MPEPITAPAAMPNTATETTRPIYVRKVPEPVWDRVHHNAIASRMRFSDYLVRLMAKSEPFAPTPCGPPPTRPEEPLPENRSGTEHA